MIFMGGLQDILNKNTQDRALNESNIHFKSHEEEITGPN